MNDRKVNASINLPQIRLDTLFFYFEQSPSVILQTKIAVPLQSDFFSCGAISILLMLMSLPSRNFAIVAKHIFIWWAFPKKDCISSRVENGSSLEPYTTK